MGQPITRTRIANAKPSAAAISRIKEPGSGVEVGELVLNVKPSNDVKPFADASMKVAFGENPPGKLVKKLFS